VVLAPPSTRPNTENSTQREIQDALLSTSTYCAHGPRASPSASAVPDLGSSGSGNGHLELTYVNSLTVPTGTPFDGFPIGGLSGIDYDAQRGEYVAISDNRGEQGPVRYYSLRLPLDQGRRQLRHRGKDHVPPADRRALTYRPFLLLWVPILGTMTECPESAISPSSSPSPRWPR